MPRPWLRALVAAATLAGSAAAAAEPCRRMIFEGIGHVICEVAAGADLRLFLTAPDGRPYGSFARVNQALRTEGAHLAFAMNGGMYHEDRSPVGLTVEGGVPRAGIVTGASRDNFGMLPNGIFCVLASGGFAIVETRAFARQPPACRHAIQSGPMLVLEGALHPRFIPGSDSRFIRNGVGVTADGQRAVFAISDVPVNFHDFARLFRDGLGLGRALYLDGSISRLYAPGLRRNDWGVRMGPILGLVARG